MTVLIDPLQHYPHVPWAIKDWCHMAVDGSFEELHAFAAQLGIPRSRFQGDHYDLTAVDSRACRGARRGGGPDPRIAGPDGRPARRPRAATGARSARSVS